MAFELRLFHPTLEHLDEIAALEAAGYPADEAASYYTLSFRIREANEFFLAADVEVDGNESRRRIVGYVCGTLTKADRLNASAMKFHEPEGKLLCIHSVCVAKDMRRRGIALTLMLEYVARAQKKGIRHLALICKQDLIPLYEKAGFQLLGPSPVVHGHEPWFDMDCHLAAGSV